MVNQRPGAGLLKVILVGLLAGLIGGMLGVVAVLRFANTQIVQTVLVQPATPTPRPTATPTMQRVLPSPTPTALPSPTATPVPDIDELTVKVVEANQRSVVTVVNLLESSAEHEGVETKALGSGIVLDREGHIVTNEHVVRGASSLRVILPSGVETVGRSIGVDELTDLAVLKIDGDDLKPAKFGDSSALRPGQRVIAIGSALGGFRNTVTVGVVSGLGRQVIPEGKEYALENLIQTDAAINHGNSGGPLLNIRGEVIGVNTILIRRERDSEEIVQGISFAIPSNTVQEIVPQLIANGRVPRPYLGAETHLVTPEVKATYALSVDHGARVEEVTAGSPAEAAGLRRGDVILAVNGEMINEDNPFINVLMRHHIGDSIELLINRVGEELTLTVTLTSNPES
ncbi:MAG: PDZ domain-containing protein [Chloroflexi bacterium]|nr:MAG: PDZ domain-containing protein [Chloroflexota bacterium]